MSDRKNYYEGLERGPEHPEPGSAPTRPGLNNPRTTALIAASRRLERDVASRRSSAQLASINYSEETGHPLYITADGYAFKPEQVPDHIRQEVDRKSQK
ncbi:predicted protein [Lichtheimia corymbifera JMRC:FSU:9682]|uniref:Uncharacterized protein n=1 Tax=Lichtheimia corymbifera JMRC:FSU:9682 TaxID=1263082 RepID=A0A068SF12_9FUNG|nr:predicted protein [Lichtheimia corymbifera JMRC:FSU:9682]